MERPNKITFYRVNKNKPIPGWNVHAASPKRDWMEIHTHMYRCLPITIANQNGWVIECPCDISAIWFGGLDPKTSMHFWVDKEYTVPNPWVKCHFLGGIITFEFDFIIRGNSSLYIDPKLLQEFLESNLDKVDYAGPIMGEKKFVAGWCIILSRRAAHIVVHDFRKSDSYYFDDEAIGLILARNCIEPHLLNFMFFDRLPNFSEIKEAKSKGNWIWRFKGDASGNRISVPAMKLVESVSKEIGA